MTGKKTSLVCHHLNGWNSFPRERYLVTNGVLLDRAIHKNYHEFPKGIHDNFKYGNNTELQFEKILLEFFNIDWQQKKDLNQL